MLSLVHIQCPHCGVVGKMIIPPGGTIIIGPCPKCSELVAIFCGEALALNKEIMLNGTNEEKEQHLLTVIRDFIENEIAETIHQSFEEKDDVIPPLQPDENLTTPRRALISLDELQDFRNQELPLLDDPAYFHTVFG